MRLSKVKEWICLAGIHSETFEFTLRPFKQRRIASTPRSAGSARRDPIRAGLGLMPGLPASTLESKIRGLKNRGTSMQGPDGQFFEAFSSPFSHRFGLICGSSRFRDFRDF